MEILKGIPVSSGFAVGEAFILDSEEPVIPRRFITQAEVEAEIVRFYQGVERAKAGIAELQQQVRDEDFGPEAVPIFDAHIMILSDRSLHQEVLGRIRDNRFTAEYAISRSLRKYEKAFLRHGDSYLAQRVSDLHDIEARLLGALLGERKEELQHIDRQVILVAHDLRPSQTALMDRDKIIGFATDAGGMTGHTAIIARAREIPAVVGLGTVSTDVSEGDHLIIDGKRGIVVVNPDQKTIDEYLRLASDFHMFEEALIEEKDLPAVTLDGCQTAIVANIEFPQEITDVLGFGGKGVGLYRTEFIFLKSSTAPDETAHFEAYAEAVQNLGDLPITIRTLDLGADKFFHGEIDASVERGDELLLHNERNPFLGCRAIRFCLENPEVFRPQIRAICRASALGDVRLMIPMVSCRDEVVRVRQIVAEVQSRLADDNIPFDPNMQIGIMVEVPSVALTLETLCDVCSFFSIGTNDLIQYIMAADRTNEHVADLYRPAHLAVLRLIKNIIDVGLEHDIPVSLCGEMAGDPNFVIFLLGLGLRSFSVSPPLIPEVKMMIRSVTLEKAKAVAAHTLQLKSSHEVLSYLRNVTRDIRPQWASQQLGS